MYLTQKKQAEKPEERKQLATKAIALYEQVRAESPGSLLAANNLAWLQATDEKNPKAALLILDEVRREPNNPDKPLIGGERLPLEFLDTIGVALRADERNQESLKLFTEAMQRYGQEPRVLMHLALAQSKLSKVAEREQAFVTAGNAKDLARDRLRIVADPQRKDALEQVVKDADALQNRLRTGSKAGTAGQ